MGRPRGMRNTAMVNGRITAEQMDWLQELADELGGNLSAALITLLSDYRPPLTRVWNVMMCPTWKKSPARWLQTDQEIHNPFIGTATPQCGQIIGTIGTNELKAVR